MTNQAIIQFLYMALAVDITHQCGLNTEQSALFNAGYKACKRRLLIAVKLLLKSYITKVAEYN